MRHICYKRGEGNFGMDFAFEPLLNPGLGVKIVVKILNMIKNRA